MPHNVFSGVPILHVIATPFPDVWHKSGDNANAVHLPTVEKLNKIFRLFVAEYLQLPVQLWGQSEDGGDDSEKERKKDLHNKPTSTISSGGSAQKMHTEF